MDNTEFKDDAGVQLRQKPQTTLTAGRRESISGDLNEALCLLAKTKISERRPRANTGSVTCTKQNSTIVAKTTDSLSTIMEICSVESILGMGVIDETLNNRCVGMIDVPDIARYLILNCLSNCNVDNITTQLTGDCCTKVQKCLDTTTVIEVINWTNKNHNCTLSFDGRTVDRSAVTHVNPFCSSLIIPDGHSLLFAMEMLCHNGVKRLVTVDTEGKCTGFYSTSMAISDIRQQAHLLRAFTQCSVEQCLDLCRDKRTTSTTDEDIEMYNKEVDRNNVISLPITATAFEAFNIMINRNITGIALMDTQNRLTGTLSIRDLRAVGNKFEHLDRLALSLKEFKTLALKEHPQIAPSTHWASDSKVPAGCRYVEYERGTMRDVLLALNDGNLGRLLIMNAEGTVCGIITLHDVIRTLLICLGVLE